MKCPVVYCRDMDKMRSISALARMYSAANASIALMPIEQREIEKEGVLDVLGVLVMLA